MFTVKKKLPMIILLLFSGFSLGADATVSLYLQGNLAFRQGRFNDAISFYEKALSSGISNSDLYYNLGNAYYKAGDLGRASLFWHRAERLNPRDQDLKANLAFLEKHLSESLPASEKSPLTEFFHKFRDLASAKKWGMSLSICIWGFWVSVFFYLLLFSRRLQRLFLVLSIIFLLFMVFFGLGFGFRYHWEKEPAGVVIEGGVSVRSGPGENFNPLFELPAGARVLIQECGRGYCKILVPPGMIGWVEGKLIERI